MSSTEYTTTEYTVRKQVLKLKIQGDNSVFDPTSQATILQQVSYAKLLFFML